MTPVANVVQLGTTWKDKDRREKGRTLYVLRFDGDYAVCRSRNREVRIRLDRFGRAFEQVLD